jgi:hypothetical protein
MKKEARRWGKSEFVTTSKQFKPLFKEITPFINRFSKSSNQIKMLSVDKKSGRIM